MLECLKPYRIGQLIFPKLIKKWRYLKYLPVFRQYAPGGIYDPQKKEVTNVGIHLNH